ncbi:hypothetical protein LZC95_19885 [Pendulispora brunnea]|uniref:Uncharacterized protein n=1 Tax=Pendulispora brunnea TaxID=2905690 RepID=A0ABZ2KN98_9BACT
MANVKVRSASIYVSGRKFGECFENTYDVESGDEPQFGDGVVLGFSDGIIQTTLSCKSVMPVGGSSVNMLVLMKNKTDLDVALATIDGKIHQVSMRVTKASVQSTHKNGTQEGTFTLSGGEPDIIG